MEARLLANAFHGFVTIHFGHHDVHDDEIELYFVLIEDIEGLLAATGEGNFHFFVAEEFREGESVAHIIVDDEDFFAKEMGIVNMFVGGSGEFEADGAVEGEAGFVEQAFWRFAPFDDDGFGIVAEGLVFFGGEDAAGVDDQVVSGERGNVIEFREEMEAAHIGEVEVHDETVVGLFRQGRESGSAGTDDSNIETFVTEKDFQALAEADIIFDEEEFFKW